MPTVLYLEASPRGSRSYSSRAAQAFLEAYRARHPEDHIEHMPLFETDLPPFDAEAARDKMDHIAKLMAGERGLQPQGRWAAVVQQIEKLKSVDKVLLSSPMWNFSIPYRLKHYLDIVVQPGLSFYVNREREYVGKIRGKPLQMILASGSAYRLRFPQGGDGTKTDFQRWYLEHIFRCIGFEDIRLVKIEPTADATPEQVESMFVEKLAEARLAGERF